jgi:hypothetical protein
LITFTALGYCFAMFLDLLRAESEFSAKQRLRFQIMAALALTGALVWDFSPNGLVGQISIIAWTLVALQFPIEFAKHMIGRFKNRRDDIRSQRYRM